MNERTSTKPLSTESQMPGRSRETSGVKFLGGHVVQDGDKLVGNSKPKMLPLLQCSQRH